MSFYWFHSLDKNFSNDVANIIDTILVNVPSSTTSLSNGEISTLLVGVVGLEPTRYR